MKQKLYQLLEEPQKHPYGKLANILIYSMVLLSISILILQTEPGFQEHTKLLKQLNSACMVFFTIEYFLRLSVCSQDPKYKGFFGKIRYMLTPFMLIDLLVLLPFYLTMFNVHAGFLRSFRILRVFKLLRLSKYVRFNEMILDILRSKKEEFVFVGVVSFMIIIVLAPIVYYAEHPVQPEIYDSISNTIWWSIVTFTTIGYGDMYPVTFIGRLVTTLLSVFGIAFYAIPGSIFTSELLDRIDKNKKRTKNF